MTTSHCPLLDQDTFYRGTLKSVGKFCVQVVVDAFRSLAFAKVRTSQMPITAAELLYDRVLPSTACINLARPCRPCKRRPYAAPLRSQRRGPFPLPRPPGPMPRCCRR